MLTLQDYKITVIDQLNYSYEVLRVPDNKPGAPKKWIKSNKYYSTIKQTLEGIKRDIIQTQINNNDYNIESFLKALEDIKTAIDNLEIKINIDK